MRTGAISFLISITLLTLSAGAEGTWRATEVAAIPGLDVPECMLFDEDAGTVYVSNIESAPEEWWSDDEKGYIALLRIGGEAVKKRWVNSTPGMILHGPKGMCLLGGKLYFTDNARLMSCEAKTGAGVKIVAEGFKQANDLATDGKAVWVSDSEAGKVYAVTPEGARREVPAPESVNGLTFHGGKLFAVSWGLHEVYELDPEGKAAPVPFGLAKHFTNLDGIEVLDDGTFIVSDFMGNQVCTIGPDRKTVRQLAAIESPADIGLDRKNGLLGVPLFMKDRAVIFKLTPGG